MAASEGINFAHQVLKYSKVHKKPLKTHSAELDYLFWKHSVFNTRILQACVKQRSPQIYVMRTRGAITPNTLGDYGHSYALVYYADNTLQCKYIREITVKIGGNKHNTITLFLICCNRLFMCNYVITFSKENWELHSFAVERFNSYIIKKANNHKFVASSPLYGYGYISVSYGYIYTTQIQIRCDEKFIQIQISKMHYSKGNSEATTRWCTINLTCYC